MGDPSSPVHSVPHEANSSSATKRCEPEIQSEGANLHLVADISAEVDTELIDLPLPEVVENASPAAEDIVRNVGKEEMLANSPEILGG